MIMDFAPPHPVQFQGSRVAKVLLRGLGWRAVFEGLPVLQGGWSTRAAPVCLLDASIPESL